MSILILIYSLVSIFMVTSTNTNGGNFTATLPPILSPPGSASYYQPYGTISYGTPPQDFNILLDTGSSASFINEVGCISSTTKQTCTTRLFKPASSSTFKSVPGKFSYSFSPDKYTGVFGSDIFGLGTFIVPDYGIALCTKIKISADENDFDGIIGLAINDGDEKYTFLDAMKKTNSGEFMFQYPHDVTLTGVFMVGNNLESMLSRSVQWISTSQYWDVPSFEISVKSESIIKVKSVPDFTYIDTGTDTLYGPTPQISLLCTSIGGTYNTKIDRCQCACNSILSNFTIVFSTATLSIDTSNGFIQLPNKSNMCNTMIEGGASKKEWGIGLVIIRQFTTIWNISGSTFKVGFSS